MDAGAVRELVQIVAAERAHYLARLGNPGAFAANAFTDEELDWDVSELAELAEAAAYLLFVDGSVEAARSRLDRLITVLEDEPESIGTRRRLQRLNQLMLIDPDAAREQLSQWRTENLDKYGLRT